MLKFYNTLTRKKQSFKPAEDKLVKYYACGPTVYSYQHVGNMRAYTVEDVFKRWLLFKGFSVKHVMNLTDVGHLTSDADTGEDKMEKAARLEGKTAWEVAEHYTEFFKEQLKLLNILEPDVLCKATDYIPEQLELVEKLDAKGYTYVIPDGVYFDTSKFKNYGKMAKLDLKGLKAGARVEVSEGKRNPHDFALWKFSKGEKRQMEWDSKYGKGFPGWHLECSAMAMKHLGTTLDAHWGGEDHIPVHHTNEIAQSEAVTGKTFSRFWLHLSFLQINDQKMSKSLGNVVTVSDLVKQGYGPEAVRFFYLMAHYRSQQNFTKESLDQAVESLKRLYEFQDNLTAFKSFSKHNASLSRKLPRMLKEFEKHMDDDLNTPMALASLFDFVKECNKALSNGKLDAENVKETLNALKKLDSVLGVFETRKASEVPAEVLDLVKQREAARKVKDWKQSDYFRDAIRAKGFLVEDSPEGPRVKPL